jgi:ABC-type sugar transport system ATPase subunit
VIELDEVVCRAGGFTLGPVRLTVPRGEQVVLLGPSGAGKSMLLELALGFRKPISGQVRFRGVPVDAVPPEGRRCGWVPQSDTLFPHLSVRENVGFARRGSPEQGTRVAAVAERLGITALLDRRIGGLSGGERRRVALARTLVAGHDTVLLDEPFSGLEPRVARQLWELLDALRGELDLTVLHVTHDLAQARRFSGRVAGERAVRRLDGGGDRDPARRVSRFFDGSLSPRQFRGHVPHQLPAVPYRVLRRSLLVPALRHDQPLRALVPRCRSTQ